MSKPVTFEAFADIFGGIEKLESIGGMRASSVMSWLNCEGFSQDMSQRKVLLHELQKWNLLKPGKWFRRLADGSKWKRKSQWFSQKKIHLMGILSLCLLEMTGRMRNKPVFLLLVSQVQVTSQNH
jgi:hypothetical protein